MRLDVYDQRGVTLLELLLALSIMAVLLVMLFGAFRIGGTLWDKSDRELARRDLWRITPELLAVQLASPSIAEVYARDSKGDIAGGTATRLVFFSQVSLFPESAAGNVYVEYRIEQGQDGYSLRIYEEALHFLDLRSPVEAPSEDFFELLGGCSALQFRYKIPGPKAGETLWQSEWTPGVTGMLPLAFELIIQKGADEPPMRRVISLQRS